MELFEKHYPTMAIANLAGTECGLFPLPIVTRFLDKAYVTTTVHQPTDLQQIQQQLAAHVLRSVLELGPLLNAPAEVTSLLLQLEEEVFCFAKADQFVVIARTGAQALEHSQTFRQRFGLPVQPASPEFYVLNHTGYGIQAEPVKLPEPEHHAPENLALHYGPDFPAWEEQLLAVLQRKTMGISIFAGPPGTGKTSYIRLLIRKLVKTHRFYYVPVGIFNRLATPQMLGFWLEENRCSSLQKVVVLEDAENILMCRGGGSPEPLSSLLNVADGLLGDALALQLIGTVNCALPELDPAILRAGRLIAYRDFKRLSREQAHQLARARGLQISEQPDYSLAEIYQHPLIGVMQRREKSIGFAA